MSFLASVIERPLGYSILSCEEFFEMDIDETEYPHDSEKKK